MERTHLVEWLAFGNRHTISPADLRPEALEITDGDTLAPVYIEGRSEWYMLPVSSLSVLCELFPCELCGTYLNAVSQCQRCYPYGGGE